MSSGQAACPPGAIRLSHLRDLEGAITATLGVRQASRGQQGAQRAQQGFRSDELCTLLMGLSLLSVKPRGVTVKALMGDLAGKLLTSPLHKVWYSWGCYSNHIKWGRGERLPPPQTLKPC